MKEKLTRRFEGGKNWYLCAYFFILGLIFLAVAREGVLNLFYDLDGTGVVENFWLTLFFTLFFLVIGLLLTISAPYLAFSKKIVVSFTKSKKELVISEVPASDSKDFNRRFPLKDIKKISHKKSTKWGGFGELKEAIYFEDQSGESKMLFDLALANFKLNKVQLKELLNFLDEVV
jgi:hypothetical protein